MLLLVKQPSWQVARACGENAKQVSTNGIRRKAGKGARFIEWFNGTIVVFINESYEITPRACETENGNFLRDLLNDAERHHGMNLPNTILEQPFSAL